MATEKRLISLDEAIAKIKDDGLLGSGYSDDERVDDVIDMLESCHIVDAVEVVRGLWVDRYGEKYANHLYECSECHKKAAYKFEDDSLHIGMWVQDLTDYCPNCGADLRGDGDG